MGAYHTDSPTIPRKKDKRLTFSAMCITRYSNPVSRLPRIQYLSSTRRRRSSE